MLQTMSRVFLLDVKNLIIHKLRVPKTFIRNLTCLTLISVLPVLRLWYIYRVRL